MSDYLEDPALLAQRPLVTQEPMRPGAIEWMLICFAQDRQLFEDARRIVSVHHFRPHEAPCRLAYESIGICYQEYGGVSFEALCETATTVLERDTAIMLTQTQTAIIFHPGPDGLLWQLSKPDVEMSETNKNLARALLQRFAHERTVVDPLRRVLNPSVSRGVPSDLTGIMQSVSNQMARLSSLQAIPEVDMAPDIGQPFAPSLVRKLTGVPFIDGPHGGQVVGDCNGIIGPTGGGKTTFGVYLAAACVRQCWAESQQSGAESDLVVYVTAEQSAMKLRPYLWSAFCQIRRDKLQTMTDWNQLSTQENLESYEIKLQADQPYKLSETERYQMYMPQLKQCMRMLDLSGSAEHPTAGRGYVDEISSYLSRYEQPIRLVVIDYAGLICQAYREAKGWDANSDRALLREFGNACRRLIAERYQTTVWALHQMAGVHNKSTPTKLLHHSDAADSKDFAVNIATCGCLSVADPSTGCRRLNWSKTRHSDNTKLTPPTLRINEDFAIMEDVTTLYSISDDGRSFLSNEDRSQIQGTDRLRNRQEMMTGPAGLRDTGTPVPIGQRTDV